MTFIKKLLLTNYRNYKNASFVFGKGLNIIYGENGVGKTNIIESISFLNTGKGILNADIKEIANNKKNWSIFTEIEDSFEVDTLSIWIENDKKKFKVNGNIVRGQDDFNKTFNIVYLIPQMQNLFIEEKGVRRKFLDRCVFLMDKQHVSRIAKYDYYIKERMRILQDNLDFDKRWIDVLENKIVEVGIEITNIRNKCVKMLNQIMKKYDFNFPKLNLFIEDSLSIENYKDILFQNRTKDRESKRTNDGVHKIDFCVFYETKNMDAKFCSTGEQKLFLISLTLLKMFLSIEINKQPLLLLDEVFSYLDNNRKKDLLNEIKKLQIQTFITATDINIFNGILENSDANLLELKDNQEI